MGEAELVEEDHEVHIPTELRGAADALERVLASLTDVPQHRWPVAPPFRLDDCSWVSNRWCELLPLPDGQKQQMLMLDNPLIRLELLHDVLDEHGMLTSLAQTQVKACCCLEGATAKNDWRSQTIFLRGERRTDAFR